MCKCLFVCSFVRLFVRSFIRSSAGFTFAMALGQNKMQSPQAWENFQYGGPDQLSEEISSSAAPSYRKILYLQAKYA